MQPTYPLYAYVHTSAFDSPAPQLIEDNRGLERFREEELEPALRIGHEVRIMDLAEGVVFAFRNGRILRNLLDSHWNQPEPSHRDGGVFTAFTDDLDDDEHDENLILV